MTLRDLIPSNKNLPVQKGLQTLRELQHDMNRLFENFFGETAPRWMHGFEAGFGNAAPAIDVAENGRAYTVTAEIPGMDSKDIQVTVNDGYLSIKGEKKEETKEEKEGYFRQERSYGAFQRMVQLPNAADVDKAQARIEKGVLTVTVPKKADAQLKERKVEIRHAA